ncbi:MAG TPA: DUF1501 domain-containing protein [Pirellulales bacterium]|jgi:hypothetical protein|nr:DUF1501 domain-containing protein [Pirellulales bacterium]
MAVSSPLHALDSPNWTRRRLLSAGGLGFLGLNLAHLLRAEAQGATSDGKAARPQIKSCILMFYYGGPSHHDTWDMKPNAPVEVRGQFASIPTNVPGIRISEHLPRCARIMDRITVIRSAHHTMRNHNSAAVEAMCGRTPLRGDLELLANDPTTDFPCYGSALTYLKGRGANVPSHVALPHVMYNVVKLPGQTAGFLGPAFEPLQVTKDPNSPEFRVSEIELPPGVTLAELDNRQALLSRINSQLQVEPASSGQGAMASYYERAFHLLRSDAVRRAFDINQEDARVRERYGRNIHGQSALLARRLVESGVRFVSVYDKVTNGLDNWDTHVNNFGRLKDQLLPPCDMAFSALVEDLARRDLLDSTLVVMLGEFGRTPKINRDGGRDHWPDCYSVVLAGGGVRGGTLYGSSDKLGAYPDSNGVTPGDLAATIFSRFGLDPATELHDMNGRPFRLAAGEPIEALFS